MVRDCYALGFKCLSEADVLKELLPTDGAVGREVLEAGPTGRK